MCSEREENLCIFSVKTERVSRKLNGLVEKLNGLVKN